MSGSPFAKLDEGLCEAAAEAGERILDPGRDLAKVETVDDPVRLQLLELLDQHLVADLPDRSAQCAVALCAVHEVIEDQRFPLAAHHKQDRIQTAGEGTCHYTRSIKLWYLPNGAY